jgi:hypothetical protein
LRFGIALATLLMSIAAAGPAQANLIITPTFDSSITTDTNAAAIEDTINSAIGVFESTYSNPIDVLIYFQEGGGLGTSNFETSTISYSGFYNALITQNANFAAIAGLNAQGGNSTANPVTHTSDIDIKSANARALGINISPGCVPGPPTDKSGLPTECASGGGASAVDGIISLNTGITYPPKANDGNNYGLMSVVEHEIDEILGLGSSLANINAKTGTVTSRNPSPEDLFRYGVNGSRIFSVNCAKQAQAFFSYDGTTDLAEFNNQCNNADFADWVTGTSAQVQDAFADPGAQPAYGPNEIAALTAIGYTLAAPEPSTWILLPTALAALALRRGSRLRLPE